MRNISHPLSRLSFTERRPVSVCPLFFITLSLFVSYICHPSSFIGKINSRWNRKYPSNTPENVHPIYTPQVIRESKRPRVGWLKGLRRKVEGNRAIWGAPPCAAFWTVRGRCSESWGSGWNLLEGPWKSMGFYGFLWESWICYIIYKYILYICFWSF